MCIDPGGFWKVSMAPTGNSHQLAEKHQNIQCFARLSEGSSVMKAVLLKYYCVGQSLDGLGVLLKCILLDQ